MTAAASAARDDAAEQRKVGGAETTEAGTTPPAPQKKQQPDPPPAEQGLRCPRCDSPNTKFCYYNNYSLSQPRHFCKACRRYWTKGGALRNVPVGGGCRKNKRSSRSAAAASRLLALNLPVENRGIGGVGGAAADQHSTARLVVSSAATSADYQYLQQGGAAGVLAALLPLLHAPAVGQSVPFVEWPSSGPAVDLIITGGGGSGSAAGHAVNAGTATNSSSASSIESLSFINQDLHWKLQQQRLATMFLPTPPTSVVDAAAAPAAQVGGAFFQMAAAGTTGMAEDVPAATSWFMDTSSYVLPCPPPPANTATAMSATNCNIGDGDHATSNNNCGSGIPAWADMSTFTVLP